MSKGKGTSRESKKGDNSDEAMVDDEILKIAKAQLSLDRKRDAANAEFRETHKALTSRLKAIGHSRKSFEFPYQQYKLVNEADTPEDENKAKNDAAEYLNSMQRIYRALNDGEQIDWLVVAERAQVAKAEREKAEEKAEEFEADL